ncbi:hypothetical protein AM499_07815 [Bacillus sp. FJAT-22090]|uniref:hypothetical protein n=1 Tax=Bacillus sp. FJAT-22090 TaxID=1581038 RepID=UPI0006AE0ECB|nr:hypothetical protein [Bacillus sp. FJAT-22090]ALC85735.1 hypothetical protein AM499_07815 [Bacillus sp. FJAT-22090]
MIPAHVSVNIDESAIRDYIQRQLDQQIQESLLLIDLKKMSEITSMSPRYLEEQILRDPRMKIIERRKDRKRWWIYKEAISVILVILDEW